MLTRAAFLRLATASAGAVATGAALPGPAAAAGLPAARPQADDVAFLAFLGVTALVERAALRKAHLAGLAAVKADHLRRLNAALGPDEAVHAGDYPLALPARALRSRQGVLRLCTELSELTSGVGLSGAVFAADAGTRLLLARLIASERDVLGALRTAGGHRVPRFGLPAPLDLEVASDKLDTLLAPDPQEAA